MNALQDQIIDLLVILQPQRTSAPPTVPARSAALYSSADRSAAAGRPGHLRSARSPAAAAPTRPPQPLEHRMRCSTAPARTIPGWKPLPVRHARYRVGILAGIDTAASLTPGPPLQRRLQSWLDTTAGDDGQPTPRQREAAAIGATFEQRGGLAAAIELRRRGQRWPSAAIKASLTQSFSTTS